MVQTVFDLCRERVLIDDMALTVQDDLVLGDALTFPGDDDFVAVESIVETIHGGANRNSNQTGGLRDAAVDGISGHAKIIESDFALEGITQFRGMRHNAIASNLVILNIFYFIPSEMQHTFLVHGDELQVLDRINDANINVAGLHDIAALGDRFHHDRAQALLQFSSKLGFVHRGGQSAIDIHLVLARSFKSIPSNRGVMTFEGITQILHCTNHANLNMLILFAAFENSLHGKVMRAFRDGESIT